MFLTTKSFKSIFDDPIWKDLEKTTSSFIDYRSEKNEDGYVLEMAVPGLEKSDLSVKIVKGRLNVKSESENKWVGEFDKTFILPEEADTKKVKASVENGVLSVNIPLKKDSESIIEVL
jgi:HSP20 family protein